MFLCLGSGQRPEKVDIFQNNYMMESLKLHYLTENEMKNANGGIFASLVVGALIGAALTQDLDDLAAAGRKGWNAGLQ